MPDFMQLTVSLTPSQQARLAAIVAETGVDAQAIVSLALSDWMSRQAITAPAAIQAPHTPQTALNAVVGTIHPRMQGEAPYEVEYWDENQEQPAVGARSFETTDQAGAFGEILSHLVGFENITFDHAAKE